METRELEESSEVVLRYLSPYLIIFMLVLSFKKKFFKNVIIFI
jgi:hypothetical protein